MDSYDEPSDDAPPVVDPYEVLGLERSATADQVKASYRKAALKHHPDKVPADQKAAAHEKFQQIAFAYAVLSDAGRRRRYDTTGSTAESLADADGFDWGDFYRAQFRDAVTAEAIERVARTYRGSDEERADVLAAYTAARGNMDAVYQTVMLSSAPDDDARFRAWIDAAVAAGEVESYRTYAKRESAAARRRRAKAARAEAGEAEQYARELGVHDKLFGAKDKAKKGGKAPDDGALAALIQKRQAGRADFLDRLAEKYGATAAPKGKKGKKRRAADEEEEEEEEGDDDHEEDNGEPSEEAFLATQARMLAKKPAAAKAGGSKSKRSKRA